MRVNVYEEEITDRVEITKKQNETRTGLRFYLYLPVTKDGKQIAGRFLHGEDDDDSSAVTFWFREKRDLRKVLEKALAKLDDHDENKDV